MNLQLPEWLIPKQSPWQSLATGAQVGAIVAQNRYRNQALRVQVEQQAQQDVLRMRELALRETQQTTMNELRLRQMEEADAEAADLPLLQEYARNPEAGPPAFKSPKSYQRLAQIDLARSRSDLGKQTAADMKDFYGRLSKVSAEDRAAVADMQREGAPAATVWGFLGQAEERQRARLQAEKPVSPSPIAKLYREAAEAEAAGETERADVSLKYARLLAEGGRGKTPSDPNVIEANARIRAAEKKFQQGEIDANQYDALLDETLSKLRAGQAAPAATTTPAAADPLGIR